MSITYLAAGSQGVVFRDDRFIYKCIDATKKEVMSDNSRIDYELRFAQFIAAHPDATALILLNFIRSRIFNMKDVDPAAFTPIDKACHELGRILVTKNSYRCVFVYPFINGGIVNALIAQNTFTRAVRISAALQLLSTVQQYEAHFSNYDIHLSNIMWEKMGPTMELLINGQKRIIQTAGYRFYFVDYGLMDRTKPHADAINVVMDIMNPIDQPATVVGQQLKMYDYAIFKKRLAAPIDKYYNAIKPHIYRRDYDPYHEQLQAAFKWSQYLEMSGLATSLKELLAAGGITKTAVDRVIKGKGAFTTTEFSEAIIKAVSGTDALLNYILTLA